MSTELFDTPAVVTTLRAPSAKAGLEPCLYTLFGVNREGISSPTAVCAAAQIRGKHEQLTKDGPTRETAAVQRSLEMCVFILNGQGSVF